MISPPLYFPVLFLPRHPAYASPVDALVALDVPYAEALECVVAGWYGRSATEAGEERQEKEEGEAIVVRVDGGRAVAALRLEGGTWIACNAYPEKASTRRIEAERALMKIARRGREGRVVCAPGLFFDGLGRTGTNFSN